MESLRQDFIYALRFLRKHRGFALLIVLCLRSGAHQVEREPEDAPLVATNQGTKGPGVSSFGLVNKLAIGRFGHPEFTLPGDPNGTDAAAALPGGEPGEASAPCRGTG